MPVRPKLHIPETLDECQNFIRQWCHDLLTPEELSDLTKISVRTLSTWRSRNTQNLPYIKIGHNLVRYRRWDALQWANDRLVKQH